MEQPAPAAPHHTNTGVKATFIFIGIIFVILLLLYFYGKHILLGQSENRPSPTPVAAASGNIVVTEPLAENSVGQDFRISGTAKVFANVVSIRVSDKITGKQYLLGRAPVTAPAAGQKGDFVYDVHLSEDPSLKTGDNLLLEIFQTSPRDGSEVDTVTIPVVFSPLLP